MIKINLLNNINYPNLILPQFSLFLHNPIENYNSQLDYVKIKKIEEESDFNKLKFNLAID
jgi:hypothetical protein